MECTFYRGGHCQILKNTICSEKCKFKKTEKEFAEAQAYADAILKAKGLRRAEVRTDDNEIIMTVKEIWK